MWIEKGLRLLWADKRRQARYQQSDVAFAAHASAVPILVCLGDRLPLDMFCVAISALAETLAISNFARKVAITVVQ